MTPGPLVESEEEEAKRETRSSNSGGLLKSVASRSMGSAPMTGGKSAWRYVLKMLGSNEEAEAEAAAEEEEWGC